ncbi:MAG TPA: tetratricopeptide repeat protein [Acetobacteraceae bacterium]
MTSNKALLALGTALLLGACSGPVDRITQGEGTSARGLRVANAAIVGGLPQAALNATEGVLSRDPSNVAALLTQAEALTAMGQGAAAAEAYRRVLSRDASPTRDQLRTARLAVGRADLAAGRGKDAEAIYATLAAANSSDPVGYNGLAVALDQQGRHGEAQAAYRKALAIADTAATRSNLGLSLAMSGNVADALAIMRSAAADASTVPRIRHNLAFALELAGQRDEAKRALAVDMPRGEVAAALAGFDAFRPAGIAVGSLGAGTGSPGAGPFITLSAAAAEEPVVAQARVRARVRARPAAPAPEIIASPALAAAPSATAAAEAVPAVALASAPVSAAILGATPVPEIKP